MAENNNPETPEQSSEPRQTEGKGNSFDLNAVIADATQVITKPDAFYRNMRTAGGFIEPMLFMVVMAAALGLFMTLLSFFGLGVGALAVGIGAIIFMPIFIGIFSFVGAAVMFVIWRLMGSERNYETAYRCVAYSTAVLPIVGVANLVPYLGSIVSVVWGMYLMAIASIEVHHRKRETAYAVCAALGLLMVVMNISSERESRRMRAQFEEFGQSMGGIEDMTPEEAGRALGEFLQGLEEATDEEGEEGN